MPAGATDCRGSANLKRNEKQEEPDMHITANSQLKQSPSAKGMASQRSSNYRHTRTPYRSVRPNAFVAARMGHVVFD
jgi:hypothetical protein